jgi:hypothetical protein
MYFCKKKNTHTHTHAHAQEQEQEQTKCAFITKNDPSKEPGRKRHALDS